MLWLVRRVLVAIPVLLGITLVTFVGIRLAPGDPVRNSLDPLIAGGPQGEAYIAERRHELGLDRSVVIQYLDWLKSLLRGDLGYSFASGQPVSKVLGERIGPTLELMATALVIAVVVGAVIGIIAALRQYSFFDHSATAASLTFISIPQFFLALLAIYFLSVRVRLFPTGGMTTLGEPSGLLDRLHHLALPGLILGLTFAGPFVRYTRTSMLETMGKEYLLGARARGLSGRRVAVSHALPNAMLPLIAVLGLQIPLLVAGAVVVETIFQWPGMGQLLLSSFLARDYPVLSGFVLILALFVFAGLLLSDILYGILDPRVRRA
jgi:peptide/nickel transport system permease protein